MDWGSANLSSDETECLVVKDFESIDTLTGCRYKRFTTVGQNWLDI